MRRKKDCARAAGGNAPLDKPYALAVHARVPVEYQDGITPVAPVTSVAPAIGEIERACEGDQGEVDGWLAIGDRLNCFDDGLDVPPCWGS